MSDESDQAGLILISRFLRFPYEKFLDELLSSTESCDISASLLFCSRILDINSAVINYRNTQGTMGVERSETPLPRKQRITLRANPYTSLRFWPSSR